MVERVDGAVRGGHDPRVAAPHVERSGGGEAVEENPSVDVGHPGPTALTFDEVEAGCLEHPDLLGIDECGELGQDRCPLDLGVSGCSVFGHGPSVSPPSIGVRVTPSSRGGDLP